MKRIFFAFALSGALILSAFGIAGCGGKQDNEKIDIVCTIFPQYDWIRTIAAGDESVRLTVLETSGQDLHNYQPSFSDTVKIYECDLFVCVGGASDKWVEDMIANPSANPAMKKIDLLELLGEHALTEEEIPGAEEDHDHDEAHGEELDEHVWLSLKNTKILCTELEKALEQANPDSRALYRDNLSRYLRRIDSLETEYAETVRSAARKTILFADRFPFRYLAEDYGLTYFAAFSGCSAETEASPSVITSLVQAVEENVLPYVIVLEGSKQEIAKTVISETKTKDQKILTMNSIQSVTEAQINAGTDYLDLMRENLDVLKQALN